MLTPEATEQLEVYFSTLARRAHAHFGYEPADLRKRNCKGPQVVKARAWIAQTLRRTVKHSRDGGTIAILQSPGIETKFISAHLASCGILIPLSYPNIARVMGCWTKKVYGKVVPIHTSAMLACKRKVEGPKDE